MGKPGPDFSGQAFSPGPAQAAPLVLGRNLWYNVHSTARLQALRSHGCVLEFGKERAKLPQFHGIMCSDEHKEKP